MQYPAKVLLAWGEAISGNREIRDWLMQNGYAELALTCHALHLDDSARSWLMANQHQHLMALVTGSEGDAQAIRALRARLNDSDWLVTSAAWKAYKSLTTVDWNSKVMKCM